jgi:hypothetical protein
MALSSRWVAQGQVPPSYKMSLGALAFDLIKAWKTTAIFRGQRKPSDKQDVTKFSTVHLPGSGAIVQRNTRTIAR